ncbi:MAG: monovalent cation/H(+) antiporter subunit G [Planctomycetota bacterium]
MITVLAAAGGTANEAQAWGVQPLLDIFATISLIIGLGLMLLGAIGVARFPDPYARMHAASKCTTLGITGMLLAACFHMADAVVVAKSVVTVVFTVVATPIGTHLLAKAAHHAGTPMWGDSRFRDLEEDKADPEKAIDNRLGETRLPTGDTERNPVPFAPRDRGAA